MVDCYNNIVEVYKQGRSYKDYDKDIIHSVDSVFFVEINQIEIQGVQRWAPFKMQGPLAQLVRATGS